MLGRYNRYHCLWEAFLQERFIWCISNDIVNEYEEILTLKASAKVAYLFMQTLMRSPNIAKNDPYFHFGLIEQDKDDNKFVDCAIEAGFLTYPPIFGHLPEHSNVQWHEETEGFDGHTATGTAQDSHLIPFY